LNTENSQTITVTIHFESNRCVDPSVLDQLGQQLEHAIDQLRAEGQLTPVDTTDGPDIHLTAIRCEVDPQPYPLQLVVHLAGGLVEDVMCDRELPMPVEVAVLDYDTDGANVDEVITIAQPGGACADASVRFLSVSSPAIDLKQLFATHHRGYLSQLTVGAGGSAIPRYDLG